MPIYEYYSPDTHKIYSFLARRFYPAEAIPRCPDGVGFKMEKLLSQFAFPGRATESTGDTGEDSPLNPRQEAAMMEIARQMEGMGEGGDPKTLGKMMRRIMEISGHQAPEQVEDILHALESEKHLEDIEEKFESDVDFDLLAQASPSSKKIRSRLPKRDPTLYELREFLTEGDA